MQQKSTMEEEVENEYMAMDAEQWGNQDDTYENAETLVRDVAQRQKSEKQKVPHSKSRSKNNRSTDGPPPPPLPLSERHITINQPGESHTITSGKRNKLVCFRSATVCLVVLCIVLIVVLIVLGIIYNTLAHKYIEETETINTLLYENNKLKQERELIENRSKILYRVSSTSFPMCLYGTDLVILNYYVLEGYVNRSFFLHRSSIYGGSCTNQHAWECQC